MKTENELPRPGTVPLPPLPPTIGAHRTRPSRTSSLAPPAPPGSARSPQASATPSVQLGAAGFEKKNSGAKVAALIVGVLILGAFFIGVVSLVRSLEGTSMINNVATGDCLADFFPSDENGESEIFLVKKTDCAGPHALEVYSTTESAYVGFETFPGQDEAFLIGQAHCLEQYALFTGVPAEESPYEMWTLVPVAQSWSQGDRKVQCLIGSWDETTLVEGTLRNSGSGF